MTANVTAKMLKNQPPEKEHKLTVEDSKKGGLVKSENKKRAARLRMFKRNLKLGKIDLKNPKWINEITDNPKSFALDILRDYDLLDTLKLKDRILLKCIIMEKIHGKKILGRLEHSGAVPMVNIQINIPEEVKKYL